MRYWLCCALVILLKMDVFSGFSISRFTNPNFCGTTYPTAYFTSSFSISETSIHGTKGFRKGQNNRILTLGFSNTGFNFNPGVGTISVSGSEVTINGYTISSTAIIVNISTASFNTEVNTISFSNIQVRATTAATVFIRRSGGTQTFQIDNSNGIPSSAVSWGDLMAGTPYFPSGNTSSNPLTTDIFINSTDNLILHTQLVIGGTCGTSLTATSFNFNTAGSGVATQNPGTNLAAAKLYYTGLSSIFSTINLFGSVASPNGAFTINGSQALGVGTYNFWLVYDITGTALSGNVVDAQFVSATVGGNTVVAASGNPAGSRSINSNVFYTRNGNVWSDNTTKWATSSGGPACSCVPTASSAVLVSHPTQLDIHSPALKQVNILSGGVLTDASRTLTVLDILSTSGTGLFQASASWSCNNVSLNGTGLSTCSESLTINGYLSAGGTTTLQMTGGSGKNLVVKGNLYVDGVLALGASNCTNSDAAGTLIAGTGTVTGTATLNLGVAKTIPVESTLTIASEVAIGGGIQITNYGTVRMENNITGGSSTSRWTNENNAYLGMGGVSSAVLSTGVLDASMAGNTVAYEGAGNQTIKIALNSIYYNLICRGSGGKSLGSAINIDGNITLAGGAQLSSAGNAITANRNWINNSTHSLALNSTGTVFFNAADSISGTGITNFHHLYVNSTGQLVANSLPGRVWLNGNFTNDGEFSHNSSDITFNGTSIIQGASTTNFYDIVVNTTRQLTLHAIETDLEGSLTVSGTGSLAHNNGYLLFSSAATQSITTNTTALTFYQAEVDNTGGGLILQRPISVTNSLALSNGIVYTTTTNILSIVSGAACSPGNAVSFVSGPMEKIGSTAFTFPLGKDTVWARLGISNISASSTFRAEYLNAPYADTVTMAASPTPTLNHISLLEHWQLDRTAGTGNAAVTLHWESAARSEISDCGTTDLRVGRWNGSAWVNASEGVVTTGSCTGATPGSISTATLVTSFSPFTFASKSPRSVMNALPLTFVSFVGACDKDSVRLNWEFISDERGQFVLESSTSGDAWVNERRIAVFPKAHEWQHLSAAVKRPAQLSYHRIAFTSERGRRYVTPIIYVECKQQRESAIRVFPNPAAGVFFIETRAYESDIYTITVTNPLGHRVYSQTAALKEGGNLVPLHLNLPAGAYFISVHNDGWHLGTQRLLLHQ